MPEDCQATVPAAAAVLVAPTQERDEEEDREHRNSLPAESELVPVPLSHVLTLTFSHFQPPFVNESLPPVALICIRMYPDVGDERERDTGGTFREGGGQ
jgi:hypothetical protein